MKQLFLKKGKIESLDVPTPPLKPNEILVKVAYSFISPGTEGATINESKKNVLQKCLTDTTQKVNTVVSAIKENGLAGTVALIKHSLNKFVPIGYSCSGEVISVGKNVNNFKFGDLVACAGAGIANHAQYVVVPKNLAVKISKQASLKQASITTIGAIAMQGLRRANLALGEKVCVIGLGLIGQLTVQLAKLAGCTVYGVDIDDSKLFLAQKFGCDHVYNSHNVDITKDIPFNTEHNCVDATIITAASQSGEIIQQAMEVTRRKGKVVLVGDVKIDFDRNPFYQKEIDFLISCSYGPGRYDTRYEQQGIDYPYEYVRWTENRNMQLFAQLVESKKISVAPLISHEFGFEQASEAYKTLTEKNSGTCGIILKYDGQKSNKQEPISCPSISTHINVGVIGAGGFAKIKLLPLISKIKHANIHTIIDTQIDNAINVTNQYGSEEFHNNFHQAINNKDIQALVIATPHALHAEQSIEALKSGKSVFVEKPAATTRDDFLKLKTFLQTHYKSLYCVDFNRSFAPFILNIKKEISNRTSPLVIHYRMNAGFIPKDHWIQSEQNGGRVIGEACHIFELFSFLTDAKPIKISVNTIDTTRNDLLTNDNFSTQISFDDGSICTLLYTSIGNKNMSKERLEVFFDGKSIVMDDYKSLYGYGLPKSFNKTTKYPDKGHKNLLTQFFNSVQTGTQSPLPIDRILTATELSLDVNDLCTKGKL